MNSNRRKVGFAFAAVLIMLCAPFGMMMTDEGSEESDAYVINPLTFKLAVKFVLPIFLGTSVGVFGGYELAKAELREQTDELNRINEAKILASSIMSGFAHYGNAMDNYAQIWQLTAEHWIRQAELSAAGMWGQDTVYNPTAILSVCGILSDSSMMMMNANVQMNQHFADMAAHVRQWNETGLEATYGNGLMTMTFEGNRVISLNAGDDWQAGLGLVANASTNKDLVWFSGGSVYTDSDSRMMNLQTKQEYTLKANTWNFIGEPEKDGISGIYRLDPGSKCLGNFFPLIDSRSVSLRAGFAVTTNGNDSELFYYENGNISDRFGKTDSIKVSIVPREADNKQVVDISDILIGYDRLLSNVWDVVVDSEKAAGAVWRIFNQNGEACSYLTTLTVPETFNNVKLTSVQKEMVTILAMQQLADYANRYSGQLKTDGYAMTEDSLALYCRGDISLADGLTGSGVGERKIYEDVVFTPIFYNDETLETAKPHQCRYGGFAVIWGKSGSLAGFDAADLTTAEIISLDGNSSLNIDEMKYIQSDGTPTYPTVFNLEVRNIDYIEPNIIPVPDATSNDTGNEIVDSIRIVATIFGCLMALIGIIYRRPLLALIGVIMILGGWYFAPDIAGYLESIKFN